MKSLKGKVAVITGASAGVGEGTAVLFAEYGCHLTLTGRDRSRLEAVVERCVNAGCPKDKIVTVIGDISDKAVRKELLDKTVATFSKVDILINNAAIIYFGNSMKTTEEQYDEMMKINLKSVFFLSKLMAPELIKTKGAVVNVSSLCASSPMEGITVQCMAKAALDMHTQCLALELAPHGVRVNSVNPSSVDSLMLRRGPSGYNESEYAQFLDRQGKQHPLGGVASPEDVANTIAFLASDMSRFTTGINLFVDGGRHCVSSAVTVMPSQAQGQL